MKLGDKIKQSRLDMGLSQRQLCGEKITRNMLSQIENGSARPSMDTLAYLASRLGKSVSYFLEEQAVVSPNMSVMEQARKLYVQREYRRTLDVLERYKDPDPLFDAEQQLLVFLCSLQEAESAISDGRLPYARQMLHQAAGIQCPYVTEPVHLQLRLLLFRAGLPAGNLSWDALLYARAEVEPDKALQLLTACEDQAVPQWHLHMANILFTQGNYADAKGHYLACEEAFPKIAIPKLEHCCKELGDYKSAYEYACKQR